jgi:hypothetical protein
MKKFRNNTGTKSALSLTAGTDRLREGRSRRDEPAVITVTWRK